jgi:hypothetical protein
MSTQDTKGAKAEQQHNVVAVKGKLFGVREYGGAWFYTVVLPAPTDYDKPQEVELRSARKLGDNDQVIEIVCRLCGYTSQFRRKDGSPGLNTRVWLEPVDEPTVQVSRGQQGVERDRGYYQETPPPGYPGGPRGY